MAGRFRLSLITVLAALAGLAPGGAAVAAPAPSPPPVATVVVQLPAGASLPPGRYDVRMRGGGGEVTATGTVVTPTPAVASTPGAGGKALLIGALILVVVAFLLYVLQQGFRVPLRRRREYEELVRLLDSGRTKEAVTGLTRIEAQLPRATRVRARFFIGYGLYQLGELDEAEYRLAALHREEPEDAALAYLLAYLRVQRRDFEGAEPVLAALARRDRLGLGQARRLYGIVLFQQATQAVTDGRIEVAAELFDRVEQLGDFRDRIPADLRSRHTVVGARALLDRDLPAARRQFEELAKAADNGNLLVSAKLGLALIAWLEDEPGSGRRVVDLLDECLRVLYPKGPLRREWPGPPSDDLAGQLAELTALGDQPTAHRELRQSLRDIYLLRSLASMRMWTEEEVNPAKAEVFVAVCAQRFACVLQMDRQFADPYLIVGMLRYRLGGAHGRRQAVAELRAAQILGVRRPELLRIVRDHENRERVRDQGYAALLRLLAEPGAAPPDPEAARRYESRFGRVPNRDMPEDGVAPGSAPTVTELSERAELLTAKLENLDGALGADAAAAAELVRRLAQDTAALTERARAIEEGEAALLALIGARQVPEETEA
jgi:hypothetical protein